MDILIVLSFLGLLVLYFATQWVLACKEDIQCQRDNRCVCPFGTQQYKECINRRARMDRAPQTD